MSLFNFHKICFSGEPIESRFVFSMDPKVPGPNSTDKPNREFTEFALKRYFCRSHFLIKLNEIFDRTPYSFIFCEPLNKNAQVPHNAQNYYYKIEDLPKHFFSSEDQETARELLDLATPDKPIIWLPKEAIQNPQDRPLFKSDSFNYDLIDRQELLGRLETAFLTIPEKSKGEYSLTIPYGGPGIYIFYDYI